MTSPIHSFDAQSAFDCAVTGVVRQGFRSVGYYPRSVQICQYRGHAPGTACSIGQLIPDSLYSPDMEQQPIGQLLFSQSASATALKQFWGKMTIEDYELLIALQTWHDNPQNWISPKRLLQAARDIAEQYNLDQTFITSLEQESRSDHSV